MQRTRFPLFASSVRRQVLGVSRGNTNRKSALECIHTQDPQHTIPIRSRHEASFSCFACSTLCKEASLGDMRCASLDTGAPTSSGKPGESTTLEGQPLSKTQRSFPQERCRFCRSNLAGCQAVSVVTNGHLPPRPLSAAAGFNLTRESHICIKSTKH